MTSPVRTEVAERIEALADKLKAIGPMNFLPEEWPAAGDREAIDAAILVVDRLIPHKAAI